MTAYYAHMDKTPATLSAVAWSGTSSDTTSFVFGGHATLFGNSTELQSGGLMTGFV